MPFAALLAALAEVPDPRCAQGQRYSMRHLLLFSVLATLAGATSYQKIIAFGVVNPGNTQKEESVYYQRSIDFRCFLETALFESRRCRCPGSAPWCP